jgi:hypothetical protein
MLRLISRDELPLAAREEHGRLLQIRANLLTMA